MQTRPGPWCVAKVMCNKCNHVMTSVYQAGQDFEKHKCTKCGAHSNTLIEDCGKTFGGVKR